MKYIADVHLNSLFENCSQSGHRSLLFVHRNKKKKKDADEQVMVLHHLLTKFLEKRPSILWCHKKNADIPRVNKHIMKKVEMDLKNGSSISPEIAFQIFLFSTKITFCSFNDTQKILGTTFGMCVIQDFEGLTPNVLCRITETVLSGGAIVFLLPEKISTLNDISNLKMDIHSKLKTLSNSNVDYRFNKRFVQSLEWCKNCLVLTEDLLIHPEFTPSQPSIRSSQEDSSEKKLQKLLEDLSDAEKPLPQLANICCTEDQVNVFLKMVDVITEKTDTKSTISLCASRGRGKSAVMGLGTAAAVYFGISNIYVTSPSPENLGTFFEYLLKGFDALDYKETSHYNIIQSTNPEFNNAIVQICLYARHRQVIQYVSPSDTHRVSQAELVVIDEAAAIPLTYLKALFGLHHVFMATTIDGYEGTGRSLSLKLLKHVRQQMIPAGIVKTSGQEENLTFTTTCSALFELTLETSIRYKPNDPVEKWLNRLLCLNCTSYTPQISSCPPADNCQLYYVNRDLLFSGHPTTEILLDQIIALLVSSHYRNSPDDLQMLSDSASHHIFVLLQPTTGRKASSIPTIFSVIQVCIEGAIPTKIAGPILERGKTPDGDLIPWSLATQFLKPKLTKLRGVRIVRITTHSDFQSMGYGSRAINLLKDYFHGKFVSLDEDLDEAQVPYTENLNGENPTASESPILVRLSEKSPETIDYIGVSYGLTEALFPFWKKLDFLPLHISHSLNKITGEHNCIMVYPMTEEPFSLSSPTGISLPKWIKSSAQDFISKFLIQLSGPFRTSSPQLAHNILAFFNDITESAEINWFNLKNLVNGHDLQRLESYTKNLSDRHLITDLLPPIASIFFNNMLPSVTLSPTQCGILVACGLQCLPMEEASKRMNLPIESSLGLFNRTIRKIYKALCQIQETSVAKHLPKEMLEGDYFNPVTISLEQDIKDAGKDYEDSPNIPDHLHKYLIRGTEEEWKMAEGQELISIKSNKRPSTMTEAELEKELVRPPKQGKKGKGKRGKRRF